MDAMITEVERADFEKLLHGHSQLGFQMTRLLAKRRRDIENKLENGEDSTFEIGARGSYEFGPDGKYSVSVWGKNLTSEQYCVNVSDLRGGLAEVLPCTSNIAEAYYGVTAKVNWD